MVQINPQENLKYKYIWLVGLAEEKRRFLLSGNGKDWNQGSGIWSCVPEHQDVDKKEMRGTVELWPSDWRNGPDVGSHAAVQNSPGFFCCSSYTFFFIKLIWLPLFCAPAVTGAGAADEVLCPPSTVLSIIRDGNSSLLTWGLFSYFSGSERCCSEHLENWDAFLGEEQAWLHPLTRPVSCLYPSSLSQF